jgi:hypothetical protein
MHTVLWTRVQQLGLDNLEVAVRADVDREYVEDALGSDIDLQLLSVAEVKRILGVLGINYLELYGIKCAYCGKRDKRVEELGALPRSELIRRRREELGLTKEGLLAAVGWKSWFAGNGDQEQADDFGRSIEDAPDSVDALPLVGVRQLNQTLRLPLHLLLGVQCPKCGR